MATLARIERRPSRQWWWFTAAGAGVATVATAVLWQQAPGQSAWLPPCLFHSMTGLFCTGCGITRAAHALAHGDLQTAWSMNALAVMALPLVVALWAHEGLGRPARLEPVMRWARDARGWALAVLIFTVGRNLAFTGWAPG